MWLDSRIQILDNSDVEWVGSSRDLHSFFLRFVQQQDSPHPLFIFSLDCF
jgi:hypothetical protein